MLFRSALAKLPIEQREAILLVGLEGMDYEGTAKVLNVPIGTVRSRLSRGRAELRKLMGFGEESEQLPASHSPENGRKGAPPRSVNPHKKGPPCPQQACARCAQILAN